MEYSPVFNLEGGNMKYKHVEIELDGVLTVKRIPTDEIKYAEEGYPILESVREYFRQFGYTVGNVKIL